MLFGGRCVVTHPFSFSVSSNPVAVTSPFQADSQMTKQAPVFRAQNSFFAEKLAFVSSALRYKSVGISIISNTILSVSVLATDNFFSLLIAELSRGINISPHRLKT